VARIGLAVAAVVIAGRYLLNPALAHGRRPAIHAAESASRIEFKQSVRDGRNSPLFIRLAPV
jgi:hypothetical protein